MQKQTAQNQLTDDISPAKFEDGRPLGPVYYLSTSVQLLCDDLLDELKCQIFKDTSALRSFRDCPPADRQGKMTRMVGRDKK